MRVPLSISGLKESRAPANVISLAELRGPHHGVPPGQPCQYSSSLHTSVSTRDTEEAPHRSSPTPTSSHKPFHKISLVSTPVQRQRPPRKPQRELATEGVQPLLESTQWSPLSVRHSGGTSLYDSIGPPNNIDTLSSRSMLLVEDALMRLPGGVERLKCVSVTSAMGCPTIRRPPRVSHGTDGIELSGSLPPLTMTYHLPPDLRFGATTAHPLWPQYQASTVSRSVYTASLPSLLSRSRSPTHVPVTTPASTPNLCHMPSLPSDNLEAFVMVGSSEGESAVVVHPPSAVLRITSRLAERENSAEVELGDSRVEELHSDSSAINEAEACEPVEVASDPHAALIARVMGTACERAAADQSSGTDDETGYESKHHLAVVFTKMLHDMLTEKPDAADSWMLQWFENYHSEHHDTSSS